MINQKSILVSVVMPTRNRASFLKNSLASVLTQTYKNIEVIVHNNNSKDNTRDIVSSFHDDRIRYFETNEDLSLLDNWSRALDKVKGTYFIRFDDDNILFPNFIERALFLIDRENLDAITFNCYIIDQNYKIKLLHKYNDLIENTIKILNSHELLYLTYNALIDSNYTIYNIEKLREVKHTNLYNTTLPDRHLDYHLCNVIDNKGYNYGYCQVPYSITRFDHDPKYNSNYVYKKFLLSEDFYNQLSKLDLHENFYMHKFSTLMDFLSKKENYIYKNYVHNELVNIDLLYEMSLFYNIYEAKRIIYKRIELIDYLSDNLRLLILIFKKPLHKINNSFFIKYSLFVFKNIFMSLYNYILNIKRPSRFYDKQIGDNMIENFDNNMYKSSVYYISDYIK